MTAKELEPLVPCLLELQIPDVKQENQSYFQNKGKNSFIESQRTQVFTGTVSSIKLRTRLNVVEVASKEKNVPVLNCRVYGQLKL